MAAVLYSAGTEISNGLTFSSKVCIWSSPSSMDSADTIVLPTVTGKSPYILSAWDGTSGDAITATISSQTVTLDAAGGTTDHVYNIMFTYA